MQLIPKPLPRNCYVWTENAPPKTQIVLHTTAGGSAEGAFQTFVSKANGLSVPYIADRAGKIFELYDDTEFWSYHLAPQTTWPKGSQDKKTIGIEMVNWGNLRAGDGGRTLYSWPNSWTQKVCDKSDAPEYVTIDPPYRGEKFFQAIPKPQALAVCDLIEMLCDRHGITRQIPDVDFIEKFDPKTFQNWSGVASHVNYRLVDRVDLPYKQGEPIWEELGRRGFR
jgi:hypothetical protein